MKTVLYSLVILVIIGCQSLEKSSKPEQIIDEEKMVAIFTDIAYVKAAKGSYKKVFDIEKINPEEYILKKYGIDSAVFAQNNEWYSDQMDEYRDIFVKVKGNLEASKIKFEKLKKEEDSIKKISDSINKAKGIKEIPELKKFPDLINDKEPIIDAEIEKAKSKRGKSKSRLRKK